MNASRFTTAALIALSSLSAFYSGGCTRDQLVAVSESTSPASTANPGSGGTGTSSSATLGVGAATAMGSASGFTSSAATLGGAGGVGTAAGGSNTTRASTTSGGTPGSSSPGDGCRDYQEPCDDNSSCCSNNCDRGVCAPRLSCSSRGASCGESSECCTKVCRNGSCVAPQSSCRFPGEECDSHDQCCSQTCADAGSGFKTCQGLEGCRPIGDLCVEGECCSGLCRRGADSLFGICAVPEFVNPCFPGGEICYQPSIPCCAPDPRDPEGQPSSSPSRAQCVATWSGLPRCRPNGTCADEGESCFSAADCCSGNCQPSIEGLRCRAESSCTPPGGRCRSSRDCCTGAACFPGGKSADAHSGDGVCKPTGLPCQQLGQACSSNAPCCDTTKASCQGAPAVCTPIRP